MAEIKKREVAYKLRIGDILMGTPIVEDAQVLEKPEGANETFSSTAPKERFRFLELGDKKIVRVNLVANIVDKYVSEGEKKYGTITIDDATGQLRVKVFGEDTEKFKDLTQGDTLILIGVLRSYNREIYLLPEIIKKTDPRYLLIRKLELEGKKSTTPTQNSQKIEEKKSLREEIIDIIKTNSDPTGTSTEEIILKITNSSPEIINAEIIRLLEDGIIYEPRPGKVRYLG